MPVAQAIRPSSRSVSLSDHAYYLIREGILRGKFRLGTVLSRRKLAEEFGMSFLPISEALQKLESEGLVESRPRVGTRVRTPTAEEIRGRYVVRAALEAESAKLCCEHATFHERLELRRMADQLDTLQARSAEREGDADLFYIAQEHHVNLHMRIAEYARCSQLKEAIEKNHVLIYNWFFDISAGRRPLPVRFHADLIEKVTGADSSAADEAMRLHVRYGLASLLEQMARSSPAVEWRRKRDE
jgi:DNA-binding GntR family transcriptional regulator